MLLLDQSISLGADLSDLRLVSFNLCLKNLMLLEQFNLVCQIDVVNFALTLKFSFLLFHPSHFFTCILEEEIKYYVNKTKSLKSRERGELKSKR